AEPANPNLDPVLAEPSTLAPGNDTLMAEAWAPKVIGLEEVWADPSLAGSKRVVVAVVSSGIDYNHEDLRANIMVNAAEADAAATGTYYSEDGLDNDQNGFTDDWVGYDFVDKDGLPYDTNGSGTAAAGIIGAVSDNGKGVRGVVSQVSLLPIRYIDANGRSNISLLAQALDYAARSNVDVVFLHLAQLGYDSRYADWAKAIEKMERSLIDRGMKVLEKRGTPVIISAGNYGTDVDLVGDVTKLLGTYGNTFFVTSVNEKDQRPFIANYGFETVGTAAPGESIMTTQPGGDQYGRVSGTFAAAAYVTGAVALAVSRHHGSLTWKDMAKALLTDGGDPIASLQYETIGGNRLNVAKFLRSLAGS
ncbi:MAG: S8 family serine peptidase, partial [Bdellovibrionota bacterium]